MKLKYVSFACFYKPLLLQNVKWELCLVLVEEGIKKAHMYDFFHGDSTWKYLALILSCSLWFF